MATLITPLTSAKQQLKEYNSLQTFGRLLPLSAIRPGLTGSHLKGFGYPYWLFNPSPAGFQTSKSFYLSSAIRNVPGYRTTLLPNQINSVADAWGTSGRNCIPWSSYTLPASATFINKFWTETFTNPDPDGKGGAFTFFVVPPVSGDPIPVVIWFPKDPDKYRTVSYTGGSDCTPINEIYVTPRAVTSPVFLQTWLGADNTARIRTAMYDLSGGEGYIYNEYRTKHPAVTSFVWIESLLGFVANMDLNFDQKLYHSTYAQRPSASWLDIAVAVNNRNLSYKNFSPQISSALSFSGALSTAFVVPGAGNKTTRYQLSSLYSANDYPKVADVRSLYHLLTSSQYLWDQVDARSGILMYALSSRPIANLMHSIPTTNYKGITANWPEQIRTPRFSSIKYTLLNRIRQDLAYWRTLTAIPLTARALFSFNPLVNTVINTYQPTFRSWVGNTDYTLYHPELKTWVIYLSAPGLQRYVSTLNGGFSAFYAGRSLPSAVNLQWPNTLSALNNFVDLRFDMPVFYKAEKTYTKFGKYEKFNSIIARPVETTLLSATGFVPLTALTITTTPIFVTDYSSTAQLTGGLLQTGMLSGTITFNLSANIPVQQLTATAPSFRNYGNLNARFVLNTTMAVKTVIPLSATILSSVNLFSTASQLRPTTILQVSGDRLLITNSLPERGYVFGNISSNTLYTHPLYRNTLRIAYTDQPTEERITNILNTQFPRVWFGKPWTNVSNNIWSYMESASLELPYTPRINLTTREILVNAGQNIIGYPRFDENGNTYPARTHQNNLQSLIPFVSKPKLAWTVVMPTSAARVITDGPEKIREIKWRKQGVLKTPRIVTPTFNRARRKRVLGY